MENRTAAIIATVASVLLCGCPGILLCIFGVLTAAGLMTGNTEFNGITNTGTVPSGYGYAFLCVALIFILIPILVGFFTLRRKPAPAPLTPPSGPLPPAI